jgi:hypothetical protein
MVAAALELAKRKIHKSSEKAVCLGMGSEH